MATSADGTRIAWNRYGEGERTILFVPTWNIVDARVVGHQVAALEPHATVLTFDPRGAGSRIPGRARFRGSRGGTRRGRGDPLGTLLAGALEAISEVVADLVVSVAGVGIASQTESFVLWERDSGRPVSRVVSWQDQRADDLCAAIGGRPEAARVRAVTGLALDPTFSAPKLAWLLAADTALRDRAAAGELLFGDVACWLAWHLCGGAAHVTEPSNACRSLLVDLETLLWNPGLLDLFGVPDGLLPEIRSSDDPGVHTSADVIGFEAPVAAMLGDQPAALYGQGCTSPRMATLTLGTGAFLWLNVGGKRPEPPDGVLATVAWDERASGPTYALEAFCANAGNALSLLPALGFDASGASPVPDWSRSHPVVVPAPPVSALRTGTAPTASRSWERAAGRRQPTSERRVSLASPTRSRMRWKQSMRAAPRTS